MQYRAQNCALRWKIICNDTLGEHCADKVSVLIININAVMHKALRRNFILHP
ncbi:hypothetical protein D3C78_1854440 [compost metagenome]